MDFDIHLTAFDLGNVLLLIAFAYLGYRIIMPNWSNKLKKPFIWHEKVKKGAVSKELISLEKKSYDKVRFYSIWLQIERIKSKNIKGAFVELGVYQGETAKIIHNCDSSRKLLLFDTFEGFDVRDLEVEDKSDKKYSTDNFSSANIDDIKAFIGGNANVEYFAGYFPESAEQITEDKFAFIHLDADLYKPTKSALEYFYPKLSAGGAIIIHDYNHNWDGNRRAIDEFITTIPEEIMEIADWQGSVLIIKNTN